MEQKASGTQEETIVECEVCGKEFLVRDGYYLPGEYSYCGDCCHW